jgi:SAM-dependent methyltransferase
MPIDSPEATPATSLRESRACRICGHAGPHRAYRVPEMLYATREMFTYILCEGCGCLQIAEIPPDLGRFYPSHYYSFVPVGKGNAWRRFKDRLEWKRNAYAFTGRGLLGRVLQTVMPEVALPKIAKVNPDKAARILDVGSGTGRFLYFLADNGFTNVAGIDPFLAETLRYPNGLAIHKQDIMATTGKWDVIIFNHSFEHIPDNLATLRQAAALLAEGGTCIIEVPTVSSFAWRHYGIHWGSLDAPRHLYLHSLKSLGLLAEQAGLEVAEIQYYSNPIQFWVSENFKRGVTHRVLRNRREALRYRMRRGLGFLPQYLRSRRLDREGQGDAVAFYLRKK